MSKAAESKIVANVSMALTSAFASKDGTLMLAFLDWIKICIFRLLLHPSVACHSSDQTILFAHLLKPRLNHMTASVCQRLYHSSFPSVCQLQIVSFPLALHAWSWQKSSSCLLQPWIWQQWTNSFGGGLPFFFGGDIVRLCSASSYCLFFFLASREAKSLL